MLDVEFPHGSACRLWEAFSGWAFVPRGERGVQAGAAYLRQRDVSAFQPGATPPWTDAKTIMVAQARSLSETWLIERAVPLNCGKFSQLSALHWTARRLPHS